MGIKSSKSGVLPGYLCCPSHMEEFCDTLADYDRDDEEKRAQLKTILASPIRPHVEPYIGKFFLLYERWDKEDGVKQFVEEVARNNQFKPVLSRLFKSMLLMYGRDCISLHIEPCSKQLNQLVTECFIELFKAGFSCQTLLHGTGGCSWFVNLKGEVEATYCSPHTRIACWAKFIQLFIQATHDMNVIHNIWRQVAPHLSYCSHVPRKNFKYECQYALFCQRYSFAPWSPLCFTLAEQNSDMSVLKSLVNCCVGAIRSNFNAPNVYWALERMPLLPNVVKEQLLLQHLFGTEQFTTQFDGSQTNFQGEFKTSNNFPNTVTFCLGAHPAYVVKL